MNMDYNYPYDILFSDNLDLTKKRKITLYYPFIKQQKVVDENGVESIVNRFGKGKVLLEFLYEPLLSTKEYNELCSNRIAIDLYSSLNNLSYSIYLRCMQWYANLKAVKNSFNYGTQIEKYRKCTQNIYSCPIIHDIDKRKLDNINFKQHFINLIRTAQKNKINSTSILLYDKENPKLKEPYNEPGETITNSVINIIYERFLVFLESESHKNRNITLRTKKSAESPLISIINKKDLKSLYNKLITGKYISNKPFDDFFKCLNGQQAMPRNRIFWKKSKYKAYYFFSKICPNFSVKALNASVVHRLGKFDSNNKPRSGYSEIDILLKEYIGFQNFCDPTLSP